MLPCLKWLGAMLLSLACGLAAQGQTIVQNNGNGSYNAPNVGQSFVATVNGQITVISVRTVNHVTATLSIYSGGQGSGISGAVGTPAYVDPTLFDIPASIGGVTGPAGGFVDLTLTTPFAVTAGQTFTFMLTSAGFIQMAAQSGNPYPAGDSVFNYADPTAFGFDAAFRIFEVAAVAAVGTPASIPTLGEWALLALAAAMAMLAAPRLRRLSLRA